MYSSKCFSLMIVYSNNPHKELTHSSTNMHSSKRLTTRSTRTQLKVLQAKRVKLQLQQVPLEIRLVGRYRINRPTCTNSSHMLDTLHTQPTTSITRNT